MYEVPMYIDTIRGMQQIIKSALFFTEIASFIIARQTAVFLAYYWITYKLDSFAMCHANYKSASRDC